MKVFFIAALALSFLSTSLVSASSGSYEQDKEIAVIKSILPSEIRDHALAEKLSVALQMGHRAGQAILSVKASRNLQVQIKADSTPVTKADNASNRIICETIHRLYPEDGILSEETIQEERLKEQITKGVNAPTKWVIDPLDGTKAFLISTGTNSSGLDPRYRGTHYGVHIGLLHQGKPVLGVNYYPEIDTFYFALDGFAYKQVGNAPAQRLNHKPLLGVHPVLNPTKNERDMISGIYKKLLGEQETIKFNEEGLFLDSFGYKMISIAEGNGCNLFIAPARGPGLWDVCSMIPLVEAMGGQVTDWEGNPLNFYDMSQSGLLTKGVIISMDPKIHRDVLTIIKLLESLCSTYS